MEFTSRQLRAFHLVAQHRNFTRAAESLLITPSGLSVLIRELERQLGFRIFDRTTRQVSLTAQGTELLALTQPTLNTLEEGMSRIEQAVKKKNRRICIGTTPWFAAHVLPPAIKEFRDGHADLQVQLFDGNLGAIVRRVEAGLPPRAARPETACKAGNQLGHADRIGRGWVRCGSHSFIRCPGLAESQGKNHGTGTCGDPGIS